MKISFGEVVLKKKINLGEAKLGIKKVYPALEDLEITPSGEEQNFKSNKYGYDNVKVKAVESDTLNIVPSEEEQEHIGLYGIVKVEKIPVEYVKPEGTLEIKTNGIYDVKEYENVATDIHEPTPYKPRFISFYNSDLSDFTEEIANLDTSNVISMYAMFRQNRSVTEIDISSLDTSKVRNTQYMFGSDSKLVTLDMSNCDGGEIRSVNETFSGCSNLTNLRFMKDLGKAYQTDIEANNGGYVLGLSASPLLTHDSLMSVINNLYDIASKGCNTQKLVLGSTNLAKLTADEIAIATAKGWTVS